MKSPRLALIAALVALPLATTTAPVFAADAAHSHDSASHATMELKQGKKWETDAPLRQGMNAIHGYVSTSLADAGQGKMTPNNYDGLSRNVMTQVTYIVQNCKLEPEADAQLHILLANIVQSVEAAEGKVAGQERAEGLTKMAQALNSYGQYFDHPGWKDLDAVH